MKKLVSLIIAIVLMLSLTVPASATTVDDFVGKAADEVGTAFEMDPNQEYYIKEESKYGIWFSGLDWLRFLFNRSYYLHEAPWCAMFVSWCSDQVGLGIPAYSNVTDMKNWYISEGRYRYWEFYTPKKGDTVFFMKEGADSHVGIIESVESVPIVPFTDRYWFKLTVIEGDCVYSGDGWKYCSVERTSREVRPDQRDTWNIYSTSNVIVGFGEN